ncbi:DNA-binding protein [Bifidobacterium sp. ESL0763]|uniref:FitA-like ribbon-helix-helix domain-containing protein n=1 Tax=Bifidobacterium sp. ESL0763 TaxID=2983227 RepID=UPI0023F88721|nr:DNA-binding protein [Bifidobacterium sp. ESL0763]MDF7664351.1 DNA-binding protein [Bifidobacterium sp. ESL0763]
MPTLTIRKVDDETVDRLKAIAKENNRSTEAEVRSIVEDFTAGLLVRQEVEETNFYDDLRNYMKQEGIKGINDFHLPSRDQTAEPMTFE